MHPLIVNVDEYDWIPVKHGMTVTDCLNWKRVYPLRIFLHRTHAKSGGASEVQNKNSFHSLLFCISLGLH